MKVRKIPNRASPKLRTFVGSSAIGLRERIARILWYPTNYFLFASAIPGSFWRRLILRCFGAKVGVSVVIKPRVRVKFPWKFEVGDGSWIGEDVWIDNLDTVLIGADCCISQGVYLCTGSHDWSKSTFNLITKPIQVGNGAWLCAKSVIAPGVSIGENAVVPFGFTLTEDLAAEEMPERR